MRATLAPPPPTGRRRRALSERAGDLATILMSIALWLAVAYVGGLGAGVVCRVILAGWRLAW